MIEKQFIAIGDEIWQDNEVWCIAGGEHCADVIATALNDLHKENDDMKFFITNLEAQRDEFYHGATENAKMNGELRKQIAELNEEKEDFKSQLDNAIEMLNKEINTSENAFEGLMKENQSLKKLIKRVLETVPMKHSLAMDLKNSVRELYE